MADPANAAKVKTAINQLSANGATCTDAGLQLAYNLYDMDAVKTIASRFTVLLSDGQPTRYREGDGNTSSVKGNDKSYQENSPTPANYAGKVATKLKADKKVTLYTLAFATADELCYEDYVDSVTTCNEKGWHRHNDWGWGSGTLGRMNNGTFERHSISHDWRCGCTNDWFNGTHNKTTIALKEVTVGEWLSSIATSGCYKNAADGDKLTISFQQIADSIKKLLAAWTVEDPMGQYIQLTEDSIAKLTANKKVGLSDDKREFVWNLWGETPTKIEEKDSTKYYTYTLTYSVKLDTAAEGFEEDKFYPTNKATKLTYVLDAVDSEGNLKPETQLTFSEDYFNVPTVKGQIPSYGYTIEYYKMDPDSKEYVKQTSDTETGTAKLRSTVTPTGQYATKYDNYELNMEMTTATSMTIGQNAEENVLKLYYKPAELTGTVRHFYKVDVIDAEGNETDGQYAEAVGLQDKLEATKLDKRVDLPIHDEDKNAGLTWTVDKKIHYSTDGASETDLDLSTTTVTLQENVNQNNYAIYYSRVQDDRDEASVTVTKNYIQQMWQFNNTKGIYELVDDTTSKQTVSDKTTGLRAPGTFSVEAAPADNMTGYVLDEDSLKSSDTNAKFVTGSDGSKLVQMALVAGDSNKIELTYRKAPEQEPTKVDVVVNHHYSWNVLTVEDGELKTDSGSRTVAGETHTDVFVGTRLSAIVSEVNTEDQHTWTYSSADTNAATLAGQVGEGTNGVVTVDLYYNFNEAPGEATVTVNHHYYTKSEKEQTIYEDNVAVGIETVYVYEQVGETETVEYPDAQATGKLYVGQSYTVPANDKNTYTLVDKIELNEETTLTSDSQEIEALAETNVVNLYYVVEGEPIPNPETASVSYQYHYTTVRKFINENGEDASESNDDGSYADSATDLTVGSSFDVPARETHNDNTYELDTQKTSAMSIMVQPKNDVIHVYYTRELEERGDLIPYEVHYIYKTFDKAIVEQDDGSFKAQFVENEDERFEDEALMQSGSLYAGQFFTVNGGEKTGYEYQSGLKKDQKVMVTANAENENKYEVVWAKYVNDLDMVYYNVNHHYVTIDEQGNQLEPEVTYTRDSLYAGETLTANADDKNGSFTFQYYTVNNGEQVEEDSYSAPLTETVTLDFYYLRDTSKDVNYEIVYKYLYKNWNDTDWTEDTALADTVVGKGKAGLSVVVNTVTHEKFGAPVSVELDEGSEGELTEKDGYSTLKLVYDETNPVEPNKVIVTYKLEIGREETSVVVNHYYSVKDLSNGTTEQEGYYQDILTSRDGETVDFDGTGVYVGAEFTATLRLEDHGNTYKYQSSDPDNYTLTLDKAVFDETVGQTNNIINIYYLREISDEPTGGTTPTPIPSDDPEDDDDDEPLPSPSTTPTDIPEETVPMTEIPEEIVPLAEIPEELVELVEEDVPLAETPDEVVEIVEEDVPLADAPSLPQTGLNWLPAILLAVGGASSSAAGLLLQRKKDEDEE